MYTSWDLKVERNWIIFDKCSGEKKIAPDSIKLKRKLKLLGM